MPLPLREYYPIGRAAELLDCTLDDLIHWAITKRISMYIKIDSAYGIIDEYPITELLGRTGFSDVLSGTTHKEKIIDLDEELEKDDCDLFEYCKRKSIIIYKAMEEYSLKHGGVDSLNEVYLKEAFSFLHYFIYGKMKNNLCKISGIGPYSTGISTDDDDDDDDECIDYDNEYLRSVIISEYDERAVNMQGFFILSDVFFKDNHFRNYFCATNSSDGINLVFMPYNDLFINVVLDNEKIIDYNDLFIVKKDFVTIRGASKNGDDISEIKTKQIPKRDNDNNYINKNIKRNSATARLIAKALIINHHTDIKNNPAKLAGVLETEIKEAKLGDFSISKDTISRWMKED
ncbi:hypothetical protein BIB81_17100 [Salmonella enterica]|nr:hypothetical protein [Salmonella enterica]